MKKIIIALALLATVHYASAAVEFIGVDGVPTVYTADDGVLSMNGTGLVITVDYDDGSPQGSFSDGSFSLTTTLVSGSHFEGGTFEFSDSSSVLLSGNVVSIDFQPVFNLLAGSGQAQVLVENLDGNLLGYSEIVTITFNIDPPFESFDADFQGDSKVNFLVPEPATLALLGLGGLLLRKRRS